MSARARSRDTQRQAPTKIHLYAIFLECGACERTLRTNDHRLH